MRRNDHKPSRAPAQLVKQREELAWLSEEVQRKAAHDDIPDRFSALLVVIARWEAPRREVRER